MLSSGLSIPLLKPRSIGNATGPFVETFPFTTKRQRQHDLLTFEPHVQDGLSNLYLYRNLHDTTHPDQGDWEKLKIATLRNPVTLAYADISLNGYNDVIIVDDYGTGGKVNPLGGRVSWFENLGSSSGEWVRREIGRFPGTYTLKTGRFTNNYSLQILAIPLTPPQEGLSQLVTAQSPSPLIIYTQPQNIASGRPWLSNVAFSGTFCHVSDACIVHPPSDTPGLLDKVLLSSKEGITLVWWEMEKWHARSLGPGLVKNPSTTHVNSGAGLVCVAKVTKDDAGYVVSAEPLKGPVLSVYAKLPSIEGAEFQHAQWSKHVLDDFSAQDGMIMQIRCVDLDGDGIDEVIALVKVKEGSIACVGLEGLWYYRVVDLARGKFEKSKIADGDIASVAAGDLLFRGKMDLITISQHSTSESVSRLHPTHGLTLHSNAFYHPLIRASFFHQSSTTTLLLSTPHPSTATAAYELPLFRLFGVTFSLVILPPQELFAFNGSPSERNGVKVLYGQVTWKSYSGNPTIVGKAMSLTVSQSRVTGRSMILDERVAGVTASAKGAIFLRMRVTTRHGVGEIAGSLETHNLIPAPYPSHVREKQFKWTAVLATTECSHTQVFTLEAFRIRFIDKPDAPDFARVHFTACRGPTPGQAPLQLPTLIPAPRLPMSPSSKVPVCQVRACIVNGSGSGGVYAEHTRLHKVHNNESRVPGDQIGSSMAWAVPSLTEVAPMWYVGDSGEPIQRDGNVVYPAVYGWLSDVTPLQNGQHSPGTSMGARGDRNTREVTKGGKSFDMWMDVDFAPFNLELTEDDAGGKMPWLNISLGCFALALVLCLHYHAVFLRFVFLPRLL